MVRLDEESSKRYFDRLNVSTTKVRCYRATSIVFFGGGADTRKERPVEDVSIPGDWPYMENMNRNVRWNAVYSGENLIYVGGDYFWGWLVSSRMRKLQDWENEIRTWRVGEQYGERTKMNGGTRKTKRTTSQIRAFLAMFALGLTLYCQGADKPAESSRVFRIALSARKKPKLFWKGGEAAGWMSITNRFVTNGFRMTKRDFVLVQHEGELSKTEKTNLGFVVRACDKVTAQLHYLAAPESGRSPPSILVVHYITPYDNPRSQELTDYFIDERWVGKGDEGFDLALESIKSRASSEVVWLGSRYFPASSWSPGEAPYRVRLKTLQPKMKALIERYDLMIHDFGVFPLGLP